MSNSITTQFLDFKSVITKKLTAFWEASASLSIFFIGKMTNNLQRVLPSWEGKTIEYSDLVKGYKQLISEPIESALSEDTSERVMTVHETVWLRILLIQNVKHLGLVRLVVELSLPNWLYTIPLKLNNDEKPNDTSFILQGVLKEMVIHLEYLLKLSEGGFRLELLAEEGIWSASTELKQLPSKKLFTVLAPPKVNN